MTTLISFLGRAPKGENGYRTTQYQFPGGQPTDPVAFFGWALHARLNPDRLVILGTAGSMWDHLFEGDIDLGAEAEEERIALGEAVEHKSVTVPALRALAPALERKLGCQVMLDIIPYGQDHSEQIEILRQMADHVQPGGTVHLDVTHGFRHLPMLALMAALHLRVARSVAIGGIWYGAYDPDTQKAPVHDLSGLMVIAEGLQALASFDKDGDYGVFEPLLRRAGLPDAACTALSKAAYFENILNVSEATGQLRRARPTIASATLSPDAELLKPAILKRLAWLDEDRQFEKTNHLAKQALQRRDYLRSVLYAFEAVIARLCQTHGVPATDFEAREAVRKAYEETLMMDEARNGERARYRQLKNLRNQVAHGTRGNVKQVQQALLDRENLHAELEALIDSIESGELPAAHRP